MRTVASAWKISRKPEIANKNLRGTVPAEIQQHVERSTCFNECWLLQALELITVIAKKITCHES
jgi:hypothetical protein